MLFRNPLKIMFLGALALVLAGAGTTLVAPAPAWAARGWLGVSLQELGPRLRDALDLDEDVQGVLVAGVVDGSPADKAGVKEGDVLVAIEGKDVESVDDAVDVVGDADPGSSLELKVNRKGSTRTLTAVLGDRDEEGAPAMDALRDQVRDEVARAREEARRARDEARRAQDEALDQERDLRRDNEAYRRDRERAEDEARDQAEDQLRDESEGRAAPRVRERRFEIVTPRPDRAGAFLGVQTFGLTDQLAEHFRVPEDQGVLVVEVVEDSPASRGGLQAGDIILAVGDSKVTGPEKLARLIRAHDPDDKVDVEIQRDGNRMHLEIVLGSPRDFGELDLPAPPALAGPEGVPAPDAPVVVAPEGIETPAPPDAPDAPEPPKAPDTPQWHEHGRVHSYVLRDDGGNVIVLPRNDRQLRDVHRKLAETMSRLHETLGDQRVKIIDLRNKMNRDRIRILRTPVAGRMGVI